MFSDDIAADAIAHGLLTAISKDVFLSAQAAIPSKPENVGPYTVIVDTGGTGAMLAHDQRYPRPSVQITVSAASSSIAKAKALQLHARYCNLYNVVLNGNAYMKVVAVQELMDLQQDPNSRPKWGFNLQSVQTTNFEEPPLGAFLEESLHAHN